ncbi:MAG: Redoxin domain protein, partial [Ilumatobacteraceae bacterium]|nr:Redoxin domain protein [Ilumatobacteraceae bacterium]
ASPERLADGQSTFTAPDDLASGRYALSGPWDIAAEYDQSVSNQSVLVLRYTAGQVNLVMATADGKPIDVTVQVDDRAPTTVTVTDSDLYSLVADDNIGTHTLRLTPTAAGLRTYAFTFGG